MFFRAPAYGSFTAPHCRQSCENQNYSWQSPPLAVILTVLDNRRISRGLVTKIQYKHTSKQNVDLCVILPVRNEKDCIVAVVDELCVTLAATSKLKRVALLIVIGGACIGTLSSMVMTVFVVCAIFVQLRHILLTRILTKRSITQPSVLEQKIERMEA